MTAVGLIFSNIHDTSIPELTRMRTIGSVPFAGRYRLIDFAISSMVNSDISKIGIVTHNNYQSLMDHIGTGKDWDLARRSGGIKILPPFITTYEDSNGGRLYNTRLEALMGVTGFISRCKEDIIVISDCDGICNIDLQEVIDRHVETNAELTIVTRNVQGNLDIAPRSKVIVSGDDGRVVDVYSYLGNEQVSEISTNILVINRNFLLNVISDAGSHGYSNFYQDIVAKNLQRARIFSYKYEGIFIQITSLESYFRNSMSLLNTDVRKGLFNQENRPIFTKLRNSAPTRYVDDAKVVNSYVADGCVIEGRVENSILFRGVTVGKGTVVKNSILMQDTVTGNNVSLNCVIADKNVVIREGRTLSGHESMPFFIPKGSMI